MNWKGEGGVVDLARKDAKKKRSEGAQTFQQA